MNTKAQEWANSYFSRLEMAIKQLNSHDLVSTVNFIKYPGVTEENIDEVEAKIYEKQIENTERHETYAPEEPFAFNEYLKEFYKISNGLHISWHSVAFAETETIDSEGDFPIANDEDDYKEGWISILPIEGIADLKYFKVGGDPQYTSLGRSEEADGALFNYFDGFNFYYDACITLRNGNHTITFGDDHSASYEEPHACDFVIYMEYALSTFFSVECRSKQLYFSDRNTVHPELEKMVETQDYSNLEALLKNNKHTDIDSVIALGYEEKGCNYADEDYLEELPEAISEKLKAVIGDF